MTPKKSTTARIKSLDGIRGLAIILVLLFHYINNPLYENNSAGPTVNILKQATYFGWVGVDLFFVLSGFLIGGILLINRGSNNYFSTFYIRRALRILPPYYLLLVVFYGLNHLIGHPDYYIFEKPLPAWSYFTFTQNFLMGWHGHLGPEGITPTWSLAIEEQFYLLCPLLIWFVNPRRLPWVLLSFIIVAPIGRLLADNWYQSYVWFHCRVDSISIGVLLAWVFHFHHDWLQAKTKQFWFILLILLLVTLISEVTIGNLGILKHTLFAVIFSLLVTIVLFSKKGVLPLFFESRLLVFFGGISYSLYLFHNLINGVLHQVILNNKKPLLNNIDDLWVSLLSLALSIGFAVCLKWLIEQPAITIGKKRHY